MRRVFFLLIVLSGLCAITLHAQRVPGEKPPIKWGDVPQEHLEMDHYAPDTNAAAVVLADYGDVYVEADGAVIFERHTRIKILTEAGYDWGTVIIPYYAEHKMQRVRDIKGQTFTPGAGGKPVRHKMDKKSIFTEDVGDGWKQVRFTLPALEPGAVIEYAYEMESDNPIFLPNWQFQASAPTLWSEYRAEIPGRYQYVRVIIGASNLAIEEVEPLELAGVVRHRWAMQDVPALREEPFMTTVEDYRASLQFQLSRYLHPANGWIDFMKTWDALAKELLDVSSFGDQVEPSRKVRRRAEELTAGLDNPREKMEVLYDFVRTTITWNLKRALFADQEMNDVLETKTATSAEMAMLLVALLRAVGLEAHPVLISTRSHGRILDVYPVLSQFNDVLAAARIGSHDYLLDATDPLRPYDLLPAEALNGKGWLVRSKNPEWIPIRAGGQYQHKSYLNAALDASGTLTAMLHTTDSEYSALDKRHALKEADTPEAFVQDALLEGLAEVHVDSFAVTNGDLVTESFETETAFSRPGYAQVAGDFIYFNPTPLGRVEENPLRLPDRTFPVDMAYPRNLVYTFRLALPEGYAVQETPEDVVVRLPLESGHFQRMMEVQDGVLTVQTRFVVKKSMYEPKLYKYLRSFFEQAVAAGADQVVLKRVAE